jgi:hypothetical protein
MATSRSQQPRGYGRPRQGRPPGAPQREALDKLPWRYEARSLPLAEVFDCRPVPRLTPGNYRVYWPGPDERPGLHQSRDCYLTFLPIPKRLLNGRRKMSALGVRSDHRGRPQVAGGQATDCASRSVRHRTRAPLGELRGGRWRQPRVHFSDGGANRAQQFSVPSLGASNEVSRPWGTTLVRANP